MRKPIETPSLLPLVTVKGGTGGSAAPGPFCNSSRVIRCSPCRLVNHSLSGTSPSVLTARAGPPGMGFQDLDWRKKSRLSLTLLLVIFPTGRGVGIFSIGSSGKNLGVGLAPAFQNTPIKTSVKSAGRL